ncbi:MAG: hypothetical protein AAGJ54_11045 [Planctomycetota bacterium]
MTAFEITEAGEQMLVGGVDPVRDSDRITLLRNKPVGPRCVQRPLSIGLWDELLRQQMDLLDLMHPTRTTSQPTASEEGDRHDL